MHVQRRVARYGDPWLTALKTRTREPFVRLWAVFSDGSVAQNFGVSYETKVELELPLMVPIGGEGMDPWKIANSYWVAPLPSSGLLRFEAESETLGVERISKGVRADLFTAAARKAIQLWPEDRQEGQPPPR